ncbi:MAG: c-type cytochrome [Deltaproteobacteria bacterium]|nr:c-type cytochrome [Deltaproteobacteria bacterium]
MSFLRILGYALAAIAIIIAGAAAWFFWSFPKVYPVAAVQASQDPAVIERGRYLANTVLSCMDCHSARDWSKYSAPITPGTLGKGGDVFDASMGLPGEIHAKNITPSGIGAWSDEELARLITTGVNRDGKAIFPMMPYMAYRYLSNDDLTAVISYLRTLAPIDNAVPDGHIDFPMNIIVRTIPQPPAPLPKPNPADTVAYGKYLVTIGACTECHTPSDHGKPLPGMAFAGGAEFKMPTGAIMRTANITPDKETGIGQMSREQFIARFKAFDNEEARNRPVGPNDPQTLMPWTLYAGMTEQDLGAIYDYLITLAAVNNKVQTFTPPPGN